MTEDDFDYDSGGCYCSTTNNPPCGYCEGHGDCDICSGHFRSEDLNENNDGQFVCKDCYEELRNEVDA